MGGLGACISPLPGMRQVGFLTRSRSVKNVADAQLEKTSLSADVFQGSEIQPVSSRGYPNANRNRQLSTLL